MAIDKAVECVFAFDCLLFATDLSLMKPSIVVIFVYRHSTYDIRNACASLLTFVFLFFVRCERLTLASKLNVESWFKPIAVRRGCDTDNVNAVVSVVSRIHRHTRERFGIFSMFVLQPAH